MDDSILNLKDITNRISDQNFSIILPPSFANEPDVEEGTSWQPSKKMNKKRKREDDEVKVTNEYTIPGVCLEVGKNFPQMFRGKLVEARSKWGKKKMCVRWHTKHSCFKTCKHKESHVPNSKVPEQKKNEVRTYVKKVREES